MLIACVLAFSNLEVIHYSRDPVQCVDIKLAWQADLNGAVLDELSLRWQAVPHPLLNVREHLLICSDGRRYSVLHPCIVSQLASRAAFDSIDNGGHCVSGYLLNLRPLARELSGEDCPAAIKLDAGIDLVVSELS